jgi:hypothetical protein
VIADKIKEGEGMNLQECFKRLAVVLLLLIGLGFYIFGILTDEPLSYEEKIIVLLFYAVVLSGIGYFMEGFKRRQ